MINPRSSANPEGIVTSNPRLTRQRLPWVNVVKREQTQRGCGASLATPNGWLWSQPRLGLAFHLRTVTQGSPLPRATLG